MKAMWKFRKDLVSSLRVGWFLAGEHIRRSSKGTTVLIIFIMILTFLNMVVVSGLLVGLITGAFSQYREHYSGEIFITPSRGREYVENSPALVAFLEHHPLVQAYTPRYGINAQVLGTLNTNPKKKERVNRIAMHISGIDPVKEEKATNFSKLLIKGRNLAPGDSGYIIFGTMLLDKYSPYADMNVPGFDFLKEVDVGSRVRVSFGSGSTTVSKDFIVKGLVKSKVDELSMRAFITDSDLKRMLPVNKEQFAEVTVRVASADVPEIQRQLKIFMEPYAVRVQTSEEAIPSAMRDIETTMAVLGNALSSFALVVASITIFIVIYINAITKRRFIGIMKGIGISPSAIQFAYVFQALFYGLVGSIIGLILTFGFLRPYFDVHPIDFPFSDGILAVTLAGAGWRVLILMAVTLLAGYIPAKLIVRRNTLDAILGR